MNKDKALYYRNLISKNGQDSKRYHASHFTGSLKKVLPSHESEKLLADHFVSFLLIRFSRFVKHFQILILLRLLLPPESLVFWLLSMSLRKKIQKIIAKSPTKSCVSDPWPTFPVKECLDILLPSITSALVLLDQSAVFDTIDHSTLLSCLQTWFDISGSILRWFRSYLMDHFQCIKIGSSC